MKTGEVVTRTGVDRETLRFYEKKGLIAKPEKNSSGYREYPQATITQIEFIKKAKKGGFSLEEISNLLKLKTEGVSCRQGKSIAQEKLLEINSKINSLKDMKKILNEFIKACESTPEKTCHLSFGDTK